MLGWSWRKVRHPAGLHLVEDPVDLRRMPAVERRPRRRAHRRGDVVVAEADPLLRKAIQRRRAVTGGRRQVEPRLIPDDQDDVQWLIRPPRRAGGLRHGATARDLSGTLVAARWQRDSCHASRWRPRRPLPHRDREVQRRRASDVDSAALRPARPGPGEASSERRGIRSSDDHRARQSAIAAKAISMSPRRPKPVPSS